MVVFDLDPMKNKVVFFFFLITNGHCSIGNSTQIYKIIFCSLWHSYVRALPWVDQRRQGIVELFSCKISQEVRNDHCCV